MTSNKLDRDLRDTPIAPRRHPFLDHPRPTAIAHRGGGLESEENTLAAFQHALQLGYSHVELDVHASKDGVVVIHHDETLERMTGDRRTISDLTWRELSFVRTHGGAAIARLEEFFAAFPGLYAIIEPKSDEVVRPLADAIATANALPRVCVGSFSQDRISTCRALLGEGLCHSPAHGGVLRIWLAGWGMPAGVSSAPVLQVPTRYCGLPVVTRRFVNAAHQSDTLVQVWTVNEASEMTRLLDLGVDGILTDRPSLLRQVLMERGQWHGRSPD